MIVYPFIDGETGSRLGMTDENWKEVGTIVKQIHRVMLPPLGFGSLRKETFNPTEYVRWVRAFETQQTDSLAGSRVEHTLRSCWMEHQPTIYTVLTFLEELAGVLQRRSEPYVIYHADLHPGNILRDPDDHLFVVDWDGVLLAPKERDFLFVRDAPAEGSTRQDPPPFFQGYGQTEIDWVALTYYRCEWVMQDLIECAGQVWFRDDLSAASKAAAAQLFSDIFAEGGEVDAAFAAAAHLQLDLSFHTKEGSCSPGRTNLGAVVARRIAGYAEVYQRLGWRMFPSIDRVYVNHKAQHVLDWQPRYHFQHVLACMQTGKDPRSPLACAIGSKGYYEDVFTDGPYPVE